MATVTAHAQKTVLEAAALEVVLELLLDIPRQLRALRRCGQETGESYTLSRNPGHH
jgi:hypothetical protein